MGSRVGIRRGADDTMHILVDGEDMGPAATGIAKVSLRTCLVLGSGLLVEGLVLTSGFLGLAFPECVGCVGSIRASTECVHCPLHKAGGTSRHPATFSPLRHWQ